MKIPSLSEAKNQNQQPNLPGSLPQRASNLPHHAQEAKDNRKTPHQTSLNPSNAAPKVTYFGGANSAAKFTSFEEAFGMPNNNCKNDSKETDAAKFQRTEQPQQSRPDYRIAAAKVGPNQIQVSFRQKGNSVLNHIKNVSWAYVDIIPDFILGQGTAALFLSVRFHLLHPQYLPRRLAELRRDFRLRLLLCLVDVEDCVAPLLEVNKQALAGDCTLLLAWSTLEAARYLEAYKAYEGRGAASIQERVDADYLGRLNDALTSIQSVNKTDVLTLAATFGSLKAVVQAPIQDLALCPGIGEKKVKRIYETFHLPFKKKKK
mmetsp:Transcript_49/g.67  ORF Transcript_49/g.67 Transcript_49/m.67 type:complete len:318 (-) Transcript_49:260-1213(-)